MHKSLKSHKIIPIPEKYVWICENVFIAEWDTHRKNRLIFDGRFCNFFKRKLKYKLPLPDEVLRFLKKSGRVLSCDASSAFFHIPNAPEEMIKNCYCIRDKNGEKKYFCFTSPPFGVTQMPRCFQKIMENVRDFFNFIGMPSLLYIDDLISLVVHGLDRQNDLVVSEWYYQILRNLGITYNAKSTFVPNSKFKFLGHNFDLDEQICVPCSPSIGRLLAGNQKLFLADSLKLNEVQKIVGKLNSLANNVLA